MAPRKDANAKTKSLASFELVKPWLDITQAKAFLSSEFLLWLWQFSESKENPLQLRLLALGQSVLVKLWIEDRLVLESDDAKAHMQTLRGGDPSRSREAETALQTGKSVKELRLGLHLDPYGDFFVLLNCKDLQPKTITIPQHQNSDDPKLHGAGLAYRLKMIDLLVDTLDSLFARFLEERTDKALWQKKRKELDEWVSSRGHAETHLH